MKLRRSACIDTLYLELPFLDRFQAAKEDGFDAVEFWSWADRDLSAVKSASDRAGIPVCGFNGDADLSLIDPAQREAYLAFLHRSLEAARFLGASGVTVHSNGLGLGGVVLAPREDLSHTVKLCSLYAGLAASALIHSSSSFIMPALNPVFRIVLGEPVAESSYPCSVSTSFIIFHDCSKHIPKSPTRPVSTTLS